MLLLSIIMLYVFTNDYLISKIIQNWEYKSLQLSDISEQYDAGIILGPFIHKSDDYPNGDQIILSETFRFTQAIQLYKKGVYKKIILCGNDNSRLTKEYLIASNIPEQDILIEDRSNNTYENAIYSKIILEKYGIPSNRVILLTSAWHMRRAYKCFSKQQLKVIPISLDYSKPIKGLSYKSLLYVIPNPIALVKWRGFLQESGKMLYFKVKGYI